jgi:hypothetical protein
VKCDVIGERDAGYRRTMLGLLASGIYIGGGVLLLIVILLIVFLLVR